MTGCEAGSGLRPCLRGSTSGRRWHITILAGSALPAAARGSASPINCLKQTLVDTFIHQLANFFQFFLKHVYKSVNETVLETISARFFKYTTYLFRPSKHYRKLLSLLEVLPISYFKHATKSRVGVNWKILSVIFLALVLFIETS